MTDIFLINTSGERLPILKEKFDGVQIMDNLFTLEQLEEAATQYLARELEPTDKDATLVNAVNADPQYNTQGVHIHIHCPECRHQE